MIEEEILWISASHTKIRSTGHQRLPIRKILVCIDGFGQYLMAEDGP